MAWIEGTRIGVRTDAPNAVPWLVQLNTVNGIYRILGVDQPSLPPANQWLTLDLTSAGIPPDALAVMLGSLLIITDGSASNIPDLAVAFQAPGGPLPSPLSYVEQTIGIGPSGGSRTNGFAIVPCMGGKIQWGWCRGDGNGEWPAYNLVSYPAGAVYGLDLWAEGYVR